MDIKDSHDRRTVFVDSEVPIYLFSAIVNSKWFSLCTQRHCSRREGEENARESAFGSMAQRGAVRRCGAICYETGN